MLSKYIICSLCFITIYTQGENECQQMSKKHYNFCVTRIESMLPKEAELKFVVKDYENFIKNLFTNQGKRNIVLTKNYGNINPNISFNGLFKRNAVLECIHNLHRQGSNYVLNDLLAEMHYFATKNFTKNYDSKLNVILSFGSNEDIINLFNEIEKNENIKEMHEFFSISSKLEYEKLMKMSDDKLKLILRFIRIVEKITLKYQIKNISICEFSCNNCFEGFYKKLTNKDLKNKDLVTEMMMYSYDISLQNVEKNEQFSKILQQIINANNLILHTSTYYLVSLLTLIFIWNRYEKQLKNCKTKEYLPEFLGGLDPNMIVDDEFSDTESDKSLV